MTKTIACGNDKLSNSYINPEKAAPLLPPNFLNSEWFRFERQRIKLGLSAYYDKRRVFPHGLHTGPIKFVREPFGKPLGNPTGQPTGKTLGKPPVLTLWPPSGMPWINFFIMCIWLNLSFKVFAVLSCIALTNTSRR